MQVREATCTWRSTRCRSRRRVRAGPGSSLVRGDVEGDRRAGVAELALEILLSDGVDVESVLGSDEVRQSAAESRALIYWIRLAASGPEVTGRSSAWRETAEHAHEIVGLRQAVTASGGRVQEIPRIDDVDVALREVLTELREQYVLGYYPSTLQGPGTWHEVEVRVGRPGARVRSREGYREGRD
jgi:VWFA-related protein